MPSKDYAQIRRELELLKQEMTATDHTIEDLDDMVSTDAMEDILAADIGNTAVDAATDETSDAPFDDDDSILADIGLGGKARPSKPAKVQKQKRDVQYESVMIAQRKKSPLLDFGLFLLLYFVSLVLVITGLLAVGITISQYTCLYAIPLAWLGIAWIRRAPLYALLISVLGVLFMACSTQLVALLYDFVWDSNCYHKVDAGMLAMGWNPFKETMIEFANSTSILPYNSGWLSYQVDNQPKASFMIGASIYALTGNIEAGKIFNLVAMIACIAICVPLLHDAFKVKRGFALIAMILTSANLITVSQIATYYNDGFTFQMITIGAVSLIYAGFKPNGRYRSVAKIAAFLSLALAVNVKTSAALYAAILGGTYFLVRAVQLWKAAEESASKREAARKETIEMVIYFGSMAFFAVCVLGAATYMVNLFRYGNPLYGMLGENSMNSLLPSLMSEKINALPNFVQFFVSMFSHTSNALFTDFDIKIPFTFTTEEWTEATMDANVGGWGILFSGIFLISLGIIIVTMIRMFPKNKRAAMALLIVVLTVILPVFIIPYLFSARYYLQPFWIPLAAMICLFAPAIRIKQTGRLKYPIFFILKNIFAVVLCGVLMANGYTARNFLDLQIAYTDEYDDTLQTMKEQLDEGDQDLYVTTISRGLFYGLFFDLEDAGITDYYFSESLQETDGSVLYYLIYDFVDSPEAGDEDAAAFLYSLYNNEYLIVVARSGGGTLTDEMVSSLNTLGLMSVGDDAEGYFAVIGTDGIVAAEASGSQSVTMAVDEVTVAVQTGETVSIVIDGTEYALGESGYNIVVYDTENERAADSVVINTDGEVSLSR